MAKFYTVALRHEAEKRFGVRRATEIAKQTAAVVRRQLQQTPLQQQHAFEHVRLHFQEQPGKPAHGVFLPKYQHPPELTKLLLQAIDRPGTEPMLSKSEDNDWAVVIQTWFGAGHPIGFCGAGPNRVVLAHLCMVVELNGDLITAYPVNSYRMPGSRV